MQIVKASYQQTSLCALFHACELLTNYLRILDNFLLQSEWILHTLWTLT